MKARRRIHTGGAAVRAPGGTSVPAGDRAVRRVEVATAFRGDLPLFRRATGYLEPWRSVDVRAEIGGRVDVRAVEEGDRVKQGELLVRLDDRKLRIELAEAEADWLKIQAAHSVEFEMPWQDGPEPGAEVPEQADPDHLYREGLIPITSGESRRRARRNRKDWPGAAARRSGPPPAA